MLCIFLWHELSRKCTSFPQFSSKCIHLEANCHCSRHVLLGVRRWHYKSRYRGQVPGSLDVTGCVHNLGLTFIDLPNYWILLPFFLLFSFFPPQRKTSQFLSTSLWGRYFNAHFKTKTVFVHSHSYSWKVSLQAGQRGRKTLLGFVQERPHRCKKAHTTFPLFNPVTHRSGCSQDDEHLQLW